MYSGEFDGAAAFSGGGFMPSQNRNVRTLLPMTVKKISEISSNDESSATIDGVDVNTVTIAGLVCSMQDKEPLFVMMARDRFNAVDGSRTDGVQ